MYGASNLTLHHTLHLCSGYTTGNKLGKQTEIETLLIVVAYKRSHRNTNMDIRRELHIKKSYST